VPLPSQENVRSATGCPIRASGETKVIVSLRFGLTPLAFQSKNAIFDMNGMAPEWGGILILKKSVGCRWAIDSRSRWLPNRFKKPSDNRVEDALDSSRVSRDASPRARMARASRHSSEDARKRTQALNQRRVVPTQRSRKREYRAGDRRRNSERRKKPRADSHGRRDLWQSNCPGENLGLRSAPAKSSCESLFSHEIRPCPAQHMQRASLRCSSYGNEAVPVISCVLGPPCPEDLLFCSVVGELEVRAAR
jgi:hypothetical protein